MADLPDPFTPSECDLRGYDWMALLGSRLFKSTFYRRARKDPRGGLAGIKLWWEAMLQTPAGSLPNDDEELCELADFGEDTKTWMRHRDVAMHGWVLCSDGRFYHQVVAQQVIAAWDRKRRVNETREGWKERQRRRRGASNGHDEPPPHGDVHRDVTRDIGTTSTVTSTVTEDPGGVTSNVTPINVHRDIQRDVTVMSLSRDKTGQDRTGQGVSPKRLTPLDRTETEPAARASGLSADAPPSAPLDPGDKPVDPDYVRKVVAQTVSHLTGRPSYDIVDPPDASTELSQAKQYAALMGISLEEALDHLHRPAVA
jgi:hypothetical protein